MPRSIHFESIENFRDLGGYECTYGETGFGIVYRSALIHEASESDLEKIRSLGIKTILDLRSSSNKEANPNPFKGDASIRVIERNVNGSGRIPQDYEDQIASYFEMLEDPYSARTIFRTIIEAEKPLLIHCNAGKDRTGIFSMMLLLFSGVSFDDVNADYMASFPYLPKMTANTKANHPEVTEVCLTPTIYFLPDFYARFLERFGSLDEYAEWIGLNEDEIKMLHNLLGKQEKSCGAVVLHEGKVLIEHMGLGHYSIPKGHVEPFDKDDFDTARREIKEEVGLEVDFIDGFRLSTHYSPFPGIVKRVEWFLAEARTDAPKIDNKEVIACYFLPPEDAYRTLTHNSDRFVVKEALLFLKKKTAD